MTDARPIPLWKVVSGIYLHALLPLNLLIAVVMGVLWTMGTMPDIARTEVVANGSLLALTAALATIAAVADLAEARALGRRVALGVDAHPDNSRDAVERALARLREISGGSRGEDLGRRVDMLGRARWDHGDPEYRRIAADLETSVAGMAPACLSVHEETRIAGRATLAATLDIMIDALAERESALGAEGEEAARIAARYVETKYRHQEI